MSLLVSSHILAELDAYCTHMLALNQGQVLELRALGSSLAGATPKDGPQTRLHYRLQLRSSLEPALQWLRQHPQVEDLTTVGADRLEFFLHDDLDAMATIIRELVVGGHALVAAERIQEDLQASYLRSLQKQRAGENTANENTGSSKPTRDQTNSEAPAA